MVLVIRVAEAVLGEVPPVLRLSKSWDQLEGPPQGRLFVEELSTNCGSGRKSWLLTFYGVTHRLLLSKSPAVKSDTEPIAMTAKGVHDPIVNQYRPRHTGC